MKEDVIINAPDDAPVILIVDDESDITATYAMLFEYHGFRVITAYDGKNALNVINEVAPDVIISDYMMPLMNGVELCTIIKKDPRWKAIPFIIQSAAFHTEDINAPYDLLLQKPVAFNLLLNEVSRLITNKMGYKES